MRYKLYKPLIFVIFFLCVKEEQNYVNMQSNLCNKLSFLIIKKKKLVRLSVICA